MNQNLFKELASLVPAQLDAGQVFTGTPTGKAVKRIPMTAVAIRNQHLILAEELKKGVPLNYRDELGRNILEYPDGHIEITQNVIPPYIQNQMKSCNHD